MGRSRKDSRRRITVDDRVYHWRVLPGDGLITLSIRADGSVGQQLWVKFHYYDDATGHRLVLPRVVRLAILRALERGWDPAVTCPPLFRLYDGDSLLPPEEWPRSPRR